MKFLNPLPDQVGSLPAQTVETFTHRLRSVGPRVRKWNAASVPTKSLIGYPSTLSTCGGDPDCCLPSVMSNVKSPLCIKTENLTVRDDFRSQRINYSNHFIAEYELRLNPDRVNHSAKDSRNHDFSKSLNVEANHEYAIGDEESDKRQGSASPYEIASGSERLFHMVSIAGGAR